MSTLPAQFGIKVGTDIMEPVYSQGDLLLCTPCSSLSNGRDFIIASKAPGQLPPGSEVRQAVMRIARIERLTERHLFVREFNPARVRRLSRAKWQPAARITGCYHAGYERWASRAKQDPQ